MTQPQKVSISIGVWIGAALVSLASFSAIPSAWAADTTTGETSEIKFNSAVAPDLNAKATALGSTVKIYEYVRNQYDYALYQGARSGSINTFLGGRGNDVDLAATLIAMLRSQGTPARYVVGTVRMTSAQAMNWLSVKNADLAYGLMRDQGIQQAVLSGDKATLNFEHVWVEALVPYTNYRGVRATNTDCINTPQACNWIPLDPSFKQRLSRASGLDPYASLNFDYTAYYNAMLNNDATRRDKNPLEIYQEQTLAWLRANHPGKTLEDISDFQEIVIEQNGLLPASLPFGVIGTPRRYNSVADHDAAVPATELKKWGKNVTISHHFGSNITLGSATVSLVDASTKRLTSSFLTGSGYTKQSVRLDGTELTSITAGSIIINGQALQQGTPFELLVSMDGPPAADANGVDQIITATYKGVVGGYYYIATGGETSNWSQVHRAAQQLLAANQQYKIVFNPGELVCQADGINCTPYVDANNNGWDSSDPRLIDQLDAMDALTGGLLYVAGSQYYAKMREDFARTDSLNKIKTPVEGFLGVVSSVYDVEYIDGTAFSILPGGLLIDMKGIKLGGSWRIDQPAAISNKHFEFLGHIGSSLEHQTWQELTGYDAISTVRGIQIALANGALLVNPKKNVTTDTVPAMYASFGFGTQAPGAFALNERTVYTTKMASWSHPTSDATQQFVALKKTPSGDSDTRLARITYVNGALNDGIGCFYSYQNQLQTLLNQYGPNQALNGGALCISSYAANTTIQQAIDLNKQDYQTYRTSIGVAYFDYLDENKGFLPGDFVYRNAAPGIDAHFSTTVQTLRNDLYLRDITQSWVEYLIPSKLSVGPNFRFSVEIRKAYDTASGNLVSTSYGILNESGVSAGGGYVDGTSVLTPATSIAVQGTTTILPTFDNATLTDQHTIAEVNNDPLRTPSTADPVSTVTGNNYHDETDLVIRGRGLNIVFTRTYNSTPSSTKFTGVLGYGWTHSYNMRLKSNDYGICPNCAAGANISAGQRPENGNNKTSSITYTDERGGDHNYLVDESSYATTTPQGEFDNLAFDTPSVGLHTLTFRNGVKYVFEASSAIKNTPGITARLQQIADPYGNQLNFGYDGSGRLVSIADNLGVAARTGLTVNYYPSGRMKTISDWTGRVWTYSYDGADNLASMLNPLSQAITYAYAPGTHNLSGITAPLARNGVNVKTTFNYYQNGKAFNYYDALGNTETLDYDLFRKSTRVTDPRGGVRTYEYDQSGRMTTLTEPDGAILLFSNSPDGMRMSKTDGLGYATQYSYRNDKTLGTASDTAGQVTREQDALIQTVDYTYGIFDQIASVKDKRGATRTTTYYSTGGACSVVGKPQSVRLSNLSGQSNVLLEDYCWNADGTLYQKTEYILPGNTTRKRITSYLYQSGSNGLNLQQITVSGSGENITVQYTYDALGRKKSETLLRRTSPTNPALLSLTTGYEYDDLDRVTAIIDALGNRIETKYDANGKAWQIVGQYKKADSNFDMRTLVTRSFDAAERLLTETDVLGNVTRYEYDAAGNISAVIDAESHITRFEYDAMSRRTAVIDPNGNRTQTAYDLAGHVTAVTNASGETVHFVYNAIGQLLSTTDAKGLVTQHSYDANGNRTHVTDANAVANLKPKNAQGASAYRQYDELNRPVLVIDALNGQTKTSYDLLGHVTSITDAAGKITQYTYDDLGRLQAVTDPLGKNTFYTWDEAGNTLTATNRLNQLTRTTYDHLNRPVFIEYLTDNKTETLSYDIYGNRQSIANGSVAYTYNYDTKNRLLSKTDSRAGKKLSFTYDRVGNILTKTDYQNHETQYRYDSANKLVSLRNPDFLSVSYQHDAAGRLLSRILSNGARSSYTYDANGWLATLSQNSASGAALPSVSYTRDNVGNITHQAESSGASAGTTTYLYDALYRLTNADYPGTAFDESYTYDAVGNRVTHTQNGTSRYYEYFPNSNRIKATHLGSMTGAMDKSFIYDDEGRLSIQSGVKGMAMVWDQKNRVAGAGIGSINQNFTYDPLNYRIGATGGAGGNKDYYLEGEHLEAIYSGANLQAKYLRGITTDELVAGWQYDTAGSLTPYIYHHDNVTSVSGVSGHAGEVLGQTSFDAFGNVRSDTGSIPNRLKYTGREDDADSGLYYYRARYYDPSIGRFISEDPLGFAAGMNFYAYVDNNPVNGNDPSGMTSVAEYIQKGIRVINKSLESHPVTGVPFKEGFADFSQHAIKEVKLSNLTGTSKDFDLANKAAGFSKTPDGFTWHHCKDGCSMQLVPTSIHSKTGHTGGAAWLKAGGTAAAVTAAGNANASEGGIFGITWSDVKSFANDVWNDMKADPVGTVFFTLSSGNLGGALYGPGTSYPTYQDYSTSMGSGASASGGFLLYPNKANTNQMKAVYSK